MSTSSLAQAIDIYRRELPRGRLLEFSLTPLDRVGIPVQALTFLSAFDPADAPHPWGLCEGIGYGLTVEEATVGAFGELTEEVSSGRGVGRLERVTASYQEMLAKHGERAVVDPAALCLEAGSPYRPDTVLEWTPVRRWATGEAVFVPVEFVACSGMDVPPREGVSRLVTPITNGHGAGTTREMAVAHGLLELLQRDGNSVQYRALASGTAVDPATVDDPFARNLLDRYDAAGIDVFIKVAATDFGCVDLYVVGHDRAQVPGGLPVTAAACGEAVHPVAVVALRKALLEFASSRARLALFHGPLDMVKSVVPEGYLEAYRAMVNPADEEGRGLAGMQRWLRLSLAEMKALLAPVFRVDGLISFADLPSAAVPDVAANKAALLAEVSARLAAEGMEMLVADLSPPGEGGVHMVKVIVPGLEVETMSYHRVGARNLRRLLARQAAEPGFPTLAGIGAPPQGAEPVLLTAAGRAALGGDAWLGTAALDALMADLYVLYREPSRHVTAFSLEVS